MADFAIEIKDMEKRLGRFALGPLSLEIPRGAIFGLVGPNGAGKTSTLDLTMGLGRADRGEIRVFGMDIAENEVAIKRRMAYAGPDFSFQIWGNVGRAIDFVRGFYPEWDQARCDRLLTEFELDRRDKIASLSFGNKIKLNLVMALSRDAEILLLDEPSIGLDPVARRILFAECLAFMQRENRTIVISSHQLADLERFADYVAIIDRGGLVVTDRMDRLLERFQRIEVAATPGAVIAPHDGLRLLSRTQDRAWLLIDLEKLPDGAANWLGTPVLSTTRLTLEELFLSVVDSSDAAVQHRAAP